ncbi:TPA: hypothetical protein ACH3X2_000234 [Trebouxia sp. C0005]
MKLLCGHTLLLLHSVLIVASQASNDSSGRPRRFKPYEIANTLPKTSEKVLVDQYMTDTEAASARVFRVYKPLLPHHHNQCDEYLYVLSGRGTFWMEDPKSQQEFGPGELLYFKKQTVHSMPDILEEPVVFMSLDTPRRSPDDIHFENPEHGSSDSWGHDRGSDEL